MKNINEDIKNNDFKPVYLLYGDEDYLKKQYRDKLISAVAGDNTMNLSQFDKDNMDVKNIISIGETLPFFAEKRIVVIENSGALASSNDELAQYIENIPDYLVMLFVEDKVDKRNKVYKTIKDKGYISEMNSQPASVLGKWITGLFKMENKAITGEAISALIDKTGGSMNLIKAEIEKLAAYTGDRQTIERTDVEAICTTQIENKIFDMIAAIGSKNEQQALSLYYDLIALKESPMRILYLTVYSFNGILQAQEGLSAGKSPAQIAKETKTAPFIVGKYVKQAKNFTRQNLLDALDDCAKAEEDFKTGRISDKIIIEMIIVKYAR